MRCILLLFAKICHKFKTVQPKLHTSAKLYNFINRFLFKFYKLLMDFYDDNHITYGDAFLLAVWTNLYYVNMQTFDIKWQQTRNTKRITNEFESKYSKCKLFHYIQFTRNLFTMWWSENCLSHTDQSTLNHGVCTTMTTFTDNMKTWSLLWF